MIYKLLSQMLEEHLISKAEYDILLEEISNAKPVKTVSN